ncbi:amidohydrolase family protein, partial [Thermodesulfobacteriota bacterium]
MKIDAFCHVLPPKYRQHFAKQTRAGFDLEKIVNATPTLTDLPRRIEIMEAFPGLVQILTVSAPALEAVAAPKEAAELARIANDELAEIADKYPDRFIGGVASLPMNDIDASLREIDRAIGELKLKGIQIFTPVNGECMDHPKFIPVYEKMSAYDLPIWIHPRRDRTFPDYVTEKKSRFSLYSLLGWPYETSTAMMRLVMGGILERFPNLKIITHHCGGMIPYFAERISLSYSFKGELSLDRLKEKGIISKSPLEYLKMFYGDTALHGSTAALTCGHAFFGTDRMLFATDMPFDPEMGSMSARRTIRAVDEIPPDVGKVDGPCSV